MLFRQAKGGMRTGRRSGGRGDVYTCQRPQVLTLLWYWCSPMKNTRATAILGRADPVSPTSTPETTFAKPKTGALRDGFPGIPGFLAICGDPTFSYFSPGFRQVRGALQIAVSRARAARNFLAVPDGSGGPPERAGPARIFFMGAQKNLEVLTVPRRTRGGVAILSEFPET